MKAVCHRCGGTKAGPLLPCPDCKVTPRGRDREVAWLFSSAHLSRDELALAADRIRKGEMPEPSPSLRALAKSNVRVEPNDRPFDQWELIGIGVMNLAFTPLAGFALWWGLQPQRPVASKQALRITVPISAALAILWLGLIGTRLFG